jgi:hypothetical protein
LTGDAPLHIVTEEQRERLHTARKNGGLCAACGRQIDEGEAVYIEQFVERFSFETRQLGIPIQGHRTIHTEAPVGVECATPELLQQTAGQDPEHCAGCGRPVYYRLHRRTRHRALCSRACINRAAASRRSARTGEG